MVRIFSFKFTASQGESLALCSWLFKDAGWVLLCPFVAFPAAFAAIVIESQNFLARYRSQSVAQGVHGAATFIWLVGNAVWMTSEMLLGDEPGEGHQMPWFSGALAFRSKTAYNRGTSIAQWSFSIALILLGAFYARCGVERCLPRDRIDSTSRADDGEAKSDSLVFGVLTPQLYEVVYIGPWICKDLLWSFELFWPAVFCGVFVVGIVADNLRRARDLVFAAELFWVLGNYAWIFGELSLDDAVRWPRFLAAAFLCIGLVILLVSWRRQETPEDPTRLEPAHEGTNLFGKHAGSLRKA